MESIAGRSRPQQLVLKQPLLYSTCPVTQSPASDITKRTHDPNPAQLLGQYSESLGEVSQFGAWPQFGQKGDDGGLMARGPRPVILTRVFCLVWWS
jgi:hypothetical protein